eukprot:TRINITY_DN3809_c0_g1_i1.p1 TRINITY_DN3809_c0_g1~~TRINITY_DN3809_c0_g1_i1.p1  ORF type:complete len:281 (+),score=26.08 TRINITY_DN3809_c0_g1_i1:196-1038(+)
MKVADRFIRHSFPRWNRYIHKLMTGTELVDSHTEIPLNETDFISRSTLDIPAEKLASEPRLLEQAEKDVKGLLNLDMQPGWPCKKEKNGHKYYYKAFEGNKVIYKLECAHAEASVEEVYAWAKQRLDPERDHSDQPFWESAKIILPFSENLFVSRTTVLSWGPINRREVVGLHYQEYLPEKGFAIVSLASTERPEVPITSKYVRLNLFVGCIIRAVSTGLTSLTYIGHTDMGGMFGKLPAAVAKGFMKKELDDFVKWYELFLEEMKAKRKAASTSEVPEK